MNSTFATQTNIALKILALLYNLQEPITTVLDHTKLDPTPSDKREPRAENLETSQI